MRLRVTLGVLVSLVWLVSLAAHCRAQEPAAGPPPPARKIPGINAVDAFPNACVSCHVRIPERNLDTRISILMKQWMEKVPAHFLAKAQAAAPAGVTLKGRHPAAMKSLENIPAACMQCHGRGSKLAPYFGRMLHAIHLDPTGKNHFMTLFQGECTHCHKLNRKTGEWSLPSGPER